MSNIPNDRYYTEDHEWVLEDPDDDGVVIVGITDFAQEQLGDIVMVELPAVGDAAEAHEPFGTVESPKSVSDVFCPVTGEVVEVNGDLEDSPEKVNEDPYGDGWMVKIRLADPLDAGELMDADAYEAFLAGLE